MDVETPGAGGARCHGVTGDLVGRDRQRRVLTRSPRSVQTRLDQHEGVPTWRARDARVAATPCNPVRDHATDGPGSVGLVALTFTDAGMPFIVPTELRQHELIEHSATAVTAFRAIVVDFRFATPWRADVHAEM